MAVYYQNEPHVHDEPGAPAPRADGGLAGYAVAKYGFILVMTIVILYFIARFLLPAIR